jgi:hypothetical protein
LSSSGSCPRCCRLYWSSCGRILVRPPSSTQQKSSPCCACARDACRITCIWSCRNLLSICLGFLQSQAGYHVYNLYVRKTDHDQWQLCDLFPVVS